MNIFTITLFIVAVKSASPIKGRDNGIQKQFKKFMRDYKKHYNSSELVYRSKVFAENIRYLDEHNRLYKQGLVSFSVRVNGNADKTKQELTKKRTPKKMPNVTYYIPPKLKFIPNFWNWTARDAVTEVKDQHHFATEEKPYCGSCFAFSTIGAIEGQYAIKHGRLKAFSEQNIVDCSKNSSYNMHGCAGGDPLEVYKYAHDYGLQAQSTYPYTGRDEKCKYDSKKVVVRVKNHKMIRQKEDHLKTAIYKIGPIAVAVTSTFLMNFYNGGIFYDPDCSNDVRDLSHGLLVVGYGTTSKGEDYWIVKNSWGSDWALQGYLLMARNKNNHCGIVTYASYPIM